MAHLRNGRTMEVSGYRLEGERIILMIEGGGELSLETRQVLSIQKSGAPRSDPGRDQTLGLPPTSGGGEPATEPNPPSPEPARTMSRPLTVGAPSDPATGAVLRRSEIEGLAAGIARKYAVEERLVLAVIEVESRFDARAVSPRGAIGLMQLMPETAARFAIGNPYDPTENIDGGVRYLKELLDRYSGQKRLALAAYNAGEEAVERWSGIPPFRETILYVDRVLRALRR
ncbi:MAG TPA: lytic transglycosylase domain-containing protein [Candidatus Polarisedimenticolia bacterium]